MRTASRWIEDLASLCARTAHDVACSPSSTVASDVESLIEQPVSMWSTHPHWPSAMAVHGPPIELSVRLDWAATPSIRIVTDVTDHRRTLTGNRPTYESCTASVIGGPHALELAVSLCDLHLDEHATLRSRMLHGLGYTSGERRGSIYFRLHIDESTPRAAAPENLQPLLNTLDSQGFRADLVAYDFAAGRIGRAKAFASLSSDELELLLLGRGSADRDLGATAALVSTADKASESGHHDVVQVSQTGDRTVSKLYLACGRWGWDSPRGFSGLLKVVSGDLGVDIAPLGTFLDLAVQSHLSLVPTSVAIGGPATQANITFYMAPAEKRVSARASAYVRSAPPGVDLVDRINSSVERAVRFIERTRARDGLGRTLEHPSPVIANARLAGLLLACPEAHGVVNAIAHDLHSSIADKASAPPLGVGRAADAVRVLRATETSVPDLLLPAIGTQAVHEACRGGVADLDDLSSLALALMAEHERDCDARAVITCLLDNWDLAESNSFADIGLIGRVLHALADADVDHDSYERASGCLLRIGHWLRATPVPADDPDSMSLWLETWIRTGGNPGFISAQRVTTALLDSQSDAGGWNGGKLTSTCHAIAALALMAALWRDSVAVDSRVSSVR